MGSSSASRKTLGRTNRITAVAAYFAARSIVSGEVLRKTEEFKLRFVVYCCLFAEMEDVKPSISLQSDEGGEMEARFADLCKVLFFLRNFGFIF